MAKTLLHGSLNISIYEAQKLSLGKKNWVQELEEKVEEFIGHKLGQVYFTVDIGIATLATTRLLQYQDSGLTWNQHFHVYCAHTTSDVVFTFQKDDLLSNVLGRASIPAASILDGNEIDSWLDILDDNNKPIREGSKLHVKIQYLAVSRETNWGKGINAKEFPGVPFTFFPQRNFCRVTLYQDAHVSDSFVPKIPLSGGKYYQPHRCWEDVFNAISNAKYFIYITGWSVYTEISLVRDAKFPNPGGDMTIGELLKKKASEGVRVLMLVWDNPTGMQETHATKTRDYFVTSDVHCVLCPRIVMQDGKGVIEDLTMSALFTHHQKTVVVDSTLLSVDGGNNKKREIVSFVGGIDLCDGRYDTQSHSLFRTLNTVHKNDFYQSSIKGASITKGGPREPWHDIHSKLQGSVAWDVLLNFEQRWKKESELNDLLLNLANMSDIFISPSYHDDDETWNVQLFRSIDIDSAFGFPETPEQAAKVGLISDKGKIVDRSIQDAYINAIRRAERFIYIENQYFLGSSYDWQHTINDATHLIPKELSLKIVSKIEKGERFTVYVVMPMWPEGEPEGGVVQAILEWQTRTVDMMYTDVIQALKSKGIEANPKDYLSFFCLGNREVKKAGEYEPPEKPEDNTDYIKAQTNRRFMIYVHAKMMIVDDEYILLGSANINQRSMDGGRDTEIAMGAFQPYHINQAQKPARGQVHGFRMSLWFEHLGMIDDIFLNPESLECARKVNEIAENYWDIYTSETLTSDLPGHLLKYPVLISDDGHIKGLPGFENFPDTSANTLGKVDFEIPAIITT